MKAKAELRNTTVDDVACTVRWDNSIVENSQRCLAFLEALVDRGLISYEAGCSITAAEAKRARSMLEVGETDLKRFWWVLRAANIGDKDAAECIRKARRGEPKTGELVYKTWHDARRASLARLKPSPKTRPAAPKLALKAPPPKTQPATKSEPKPESKPEPEPKPTKHPHEDKIDAAVKKVSENRLLTSDGQIALALAEELVATDVYNLKREAKRGANAIIAKKIKKALNLAIGEVAAAVTLLRFHPELLAVVRAGTDSCKRTLNYWVHGRLHGQPIKKTTKKEEDEEQVFEAPSIDLDGFDLGSFVQAAQDRVKGASEKKDLAHALSELLAAANGGLDAIRIAAAAEPRDQEVLDIARKAQAEIAATKMSAAHLVTNRAEDKAHTARKAIGSARPIRGLSRQAKKEMS